MHINKKNILLFRNIFMMWFVLFALSPCSVKKVLLNVAESEYKQPLNKWRTNVPANCHYSQQDYQQTTVSKQSEIKKVIEPVDFAAPRLFTATAVTIQNHYSKTFSGNSPPLYILFKRLKVDLA